MTNPYRIEGPALISFSGGRTSGYMLWHILDAYDGKLPDNVHVCFANTGKEREETLRFVHECGTRWGVSIRWLEWRSRRKKVPVAERFEEVGFNSASRKGEPFKALVTDKSYTPNSLMRFCTEHLKVQTISDFMEAQGLRQGEYREAIGLRSDEMMRVFKMYARNENDGRKCVAPLADARVTKAIVREWWKAQPFDLGTEDGNCDLCWLKGKARIKHTIRREPERARDWIEMETLGKGRFVTEYSYADLVREVANSPLLPLEDGDDDEFDAECGLWCPGEEAA